MQSFDARGLRRITKGTVHFVFAVFRVTQQISGKKQDANLTFNSIILQPIPIANQLFSRSTQLNWLYNILDCLFFYRFFKIYLFELVLVMCYKLLGADDRKINKLIFPSLIFDTPLKKRVFINYYILQGTIWRYHNNVGMYLPPDHIL